MGSTVPTGREEATVSLIVGLPGELHSVARASGSNYIDLQPLLAQKSEGGPSQFRRAPAACGGINDGEEAIHFGREPTCNANFRSTKIYSRRLHKERITE